MKTKIFLILMIAVLSSSGCISTESKWDETSYLVTKITWCYGECIDEAKEKLNELEEMTGALNHEEWQGKFEENEVAHDNCMILCQYTDGEILVKNYTKVDVKEECEDICVPGTKSNREYEACMHECVPGLMI